MDLGVKDELIKFWGQKVNGQGRSRVKYTPKCTDISSVSFLSHDGRGIIVDGVVATI